MRPTLLVSVLVVAATAWLTPASAELLSKSYHFKEGVTLELGTTLDAGLRVDSVRFHFPGGSGARVVRTRGLVRATVAVSNTSEKSRRIGIAIALLDESGRLVGVASGGSKVVAIRPGRQKLFSLVFDDVNSEAFRASMFQISVETKP